MEGFDSYRVLGVEPGSSGEEIKAAYRYLSKKYHPDRTGDPHTSGRFVRVVKAYKTLDARLRKDSLVASPVRPARGAEDDVFALGSKVLTSADPAERRAAARRLGFTGRKAAYVFLRRALADRDEGVVAAAVRSVADISAQQAEPEIAALWARAPEAVRGAILDAAESTGEALFREALELASAGTGLQALRARRLLREMAPAGGAVRGRVVS